VMSGPAAQRCGDMASRRHRVVAIGSGLGGLTATKALRHAQVNITDALTFLTRVTAQGTSHVLNQTPQWLQVIPTAGVAATIGVLIALRVAVAREPKKAAERTQTPSTDGCTLPRRKATCCGSSSKVVLSCVRTPMSVDSWWTVGIEKVTDAVTNHSCWRR
jgi:hypothetical protein